MTIWEYIDTLEEEDAEIAEAAQRAQHAINVCINLSTYPTKTMQNAPVPDKKSLEEEAAETKRIDEMTLADYKRAIRKLDRKPWDEKA